MRPIERRFVLCLGLAGAIGCGDPTGEGVDGGPRDGALETDATPADAAMAPSDARSATDAHASDGGDAGPAPELALPPANAGFDYQLGGAYAPPAGVAIVSRDRLESPASGLYNLCYVNGFQVQPDDESFWLSEHPELVLRDASGDPVIDPDWDEMLLDPSTPAKREAIATIVGGWIARCAADGFDAVEIDNLDSYSRSGGRLTEDHAVALMRLFADAAHAGGMAIAQKNSTELLGRRAEMATDFAVAEECNRYDECADYVSAYGDAVLVIEYRRADFDAGCADFPGLSIVLRDLDLVTPSSADYVYDGC
jgi:hypothetical protein